MKPTLPTPRLCHCAAWDEDECVCGAWRDTQRSTREILEAVQAECTCRSREYGEEEGDCPACQVWWRLYPKEVKQQAATQSDSTYNLGS